MSKIEVIYSDDVVDVKAAELVDYAADLDASSTATDIRRVLQTFVGETVAQRVWPSFDIRGENTLIAEVLALLKDRPRQEEEE